MQSFIISHSSCAEQYGDMSSDGENNTVNIWFTVVWSYYVQMMGYWEKIVTKPYVVSKEAHACVLCHGEKSSSILPGQKRYCPFCEGPLFGLFGTGVTVAPLSGYAKPEECASYRPLAYAHNRRRDARFSIKTNMPTSSALNVMMNYYCIALIALYSS